MRDLKRVILHCSATPEGREVSVEDIRLDGLTEMGRPVSIQGAHTSGENEDSVGVCYIGGLDTSMAPKDTMTVPQEIAFVELVKSLRLIFGELSIHGHNEYSTKACPSFSVEQKFGFLNK